MDRETRLATIKEFENSIDEWLSSMTNMFGEFERFEAMERLYDYTPDLQRKQTEHVFAVYNQDLMTVKEFFETMQSLMTRYQANKVPIEMTYREPTLYFPEGNIYLTIGGTK